MDRNTFESCASPSCHGNTYTDDAAQVWSGVPLWLLAGRVDDENPHEGLAFDRALAEAGYLIELTAADGYTTTIDSAAIAQIDEIIVAYLVNENPLDEDSFPLRLIGPGLSKKQMVGQIRQIALQEAAAPAEEPAATPEPTPEPVAEPAAPLPACEGALAIAGLVETAQCWTLADMQAQPTVELIIEHPKKGPQPYSGWRLNDLLDLAGPAAEAVTLVFTASDGYSGEAALADVQACPDCLVALDDDDLLSLAMPGFESFVWVKDVVQVEVK
jgi:DMSO/TMAO reductase YedYZ molybdopterin-dependent catalytic subunit